MLDSFDWLRRSRTGAELVATLRYLESRSDLPASEAAIGPPHSALANPCQRCWIYPRAPQANYCEFCCAILPDALRLGDLSRDSAVIWAFVNRSPKQLHDDALLREERVFGVYRRDAQRFLLLMHRRQLKPWLQELLIYHGTELKGLIQIFPTVGLQQNISMGDMLCRAIHYEAVFPFDQLRVRFYSSAYQLVRPHLRDKEGILNFEAAEFLRLLEMATVFRSLLHPDKQRMLSELLQIDDAAEEGFYWGRFLGMLSQKEKDMLSAWRIRHWSKHQIKLLYELIGYVGFIHSD